MKRWQGFWLWRWLWLRPPPLLLNALMKKKNNFYAQPLRRERLFADVAAADDKRAWMQKKITVAMQDICNDEEKTSAFITAINYMAQKIDPEVQKASELKEDEARAELVDRINDLFWDGKKFVEKEPF